MRLKILIFPVAIILSIVLFINLVWPEYETMSTNQEDLERAEKRYEHAIEKQQNINALTQDLSANAQYEKVVYQYLPYLSEEENIINLLNVIVNNADVEVNGMSVTPHKANKTNSGASGGAASAVGVLSEDALLKQSKLDMQSLQVMISALGDYGKMVRFLDGAYKIDRQNLVFSLDITKPQEEDQNLLQLELALNYGYAPKASISEGETSNIFTQSSFDFSVVQQHLEDVMQHAEITGSAQGRPNPFEQRIQ
jgi:tetratricopeptide (TPR) repeat protein